MCVRYNFVCLPCGLDPTPCTSMISEKVGFIITQLGGVWIMEATCYIPVVICLKDVQALRSSLLFS